MGFTATDHNLKVAVLLSLLFSAESIRIGFSQRKQTVSEAIIFTEDFVLRERLPLILDVHADMEADRDYTLQFRHIPNVDSSSAATVASFFTPFCSGHDATFGADDRIEEIHIIPSGHIFPESRVFVFIVNDFLPEEEECLTFDISPESIGETFTCKDDEDNPTDYFCLHTICIEDDDNPNAPFIVGFEMSSYNVTEGESVAVCIKLFSSPEQEITMLSDIFPVVSQANAFSEMVADIDNDYSFEFNNSIPLTQSQRNYCFNVMAFDDIQLEQVEVLALDVCIEVGNSQTIILPTSSKVYIEIFDNDEAQIQFQRTEYDSNDEICVTLVPVSEFVLQVLLVIQSEQARHINKTLVFKDSQSEVCIFLCTVMPENSVFEISLAPTADHDPRVQLVPEFSTATVLNTNDYDVGVTWENNGYIASGLSAVTVCVVVYSTLSLREVDITIAILPDGGEAIHYPMRLMSAFEEKGCLNIDLTSIHCKNAILRVSSEDEQVCILDESSSITIDIPNTRCAPMIVGYEMTEYEIPAASTVTTVEFCAVILASPNGLALRPFTLETFSMNSSEALISFQTLEDGLLSFETNDSRHCHQFNVMVSSEDILCNDFSMVTFTSLLRVQSGDGDIFVQPKSARLIITESEDPQCAPIYIGFSELPYTVMEGEGVIICADISIPTEGAPRPFSVTLTTGNGTADIDDFVQLSATMLFGVGDAIECVTVSSNSDDICEYPECGFEYFKAYLNTSDRNIILQQSMARVFIEEDIMTPNCSQLLSDLNCVTPSPISNTNQLLYVYIFVPLGLLGLLIVVALIVFILVWRRKKKWTISLPKYHHYANDHGKLPQVKSIIVLDEIRNTVPKNMMFAKDCIQLSNIVGQGESGVVYKAILKTKNGSDLVAIKTVKALFARSDVSRLIKEINVMVSFNHPNVMTLRGVCLDKENPLLIMPFMSNGSVLEYVRRHKGYLMLTEDTDTLQISSARKKLLGMCLQIAKGMQYLARERIVHRDLAARNCMIDMNDVIKVADFGLTEDVYAAEYFRKSKSDSGSDEKVPLRWMAPESINSDLYTEKTDVWSFGVTCWEVFTCGQVPYSGIPVTKLFNMLTSGVRLDRPINSACTDEIFCTMYRCWNEEANRRPNFKILVDQISNQLEKEAGYVDFNEPLYDN